MLDHFEHHYQIESERLEREVVIQIRGGPSGTARMKLGGKNPPPALLEHSSGKAIAGTDIQCDTGLETGRNKFDSTADALTHIIRDSLAGTDDATATDSGLNSRLGPDKPCHLSTRARVAEWQTRKAQDLVSASSWGFKSPLSQF